MAIGLSLHFAVAAPGPDCCPMEPVSGSPEDARALADLARKAGFWVRDVLDHQVNADRMIGALQGAAAELVKGDLLLVTFSGHGCQIEDDGSGEPEGGFDETWCLSDGQLRDDRLHEAWAKFRPGVRILVIADSCHSRTSGWIAANKSVNASPASTSRVGRPSRRERARAWGVSDEGMELLIARRPDRVPINASVILLSACDDHESAQARNGRSLFVTKLLEVWAAGSFPGHGTYVSFIEEVRHRVALENPSQHPGWAPFGQGAEAFLRQRPFTI
jgi:hypothetical protein